MLKGALPGPKVPEKRKRLPVVAAAFGTSLSVSNSDVLATLLPFPQTAAHQEKRNRSTRSQLQSKVIEYKAPSVAPATTATAHLRSPRSPIPTRPTAPGEGASAARCNPRRPESFGEGTAVLRLRWLVPSGFAHEAVAAAVHNDNTSRPILELPTVSTAETSAAQCSLQQP